LTWISAVIPGQRRPRVTFSADTYEFIAEILSYVYIVTCFHDKHL